MSICFCTTKLLKIIEITKRIGNFFRSPIQLFSSPAYPELALVGTSYKNGEGALNNLKHDFAQHATDGQTFREIVPIEVEGKRVLMFKIPASPRNIVMKWKGIAYGRDGESLKPLNQSKHDEIRHQTPEPDWSAEIVPNATIDDLDEVAIAKAKMMFRKDTA